MDRERIVFAAAAVLAVLVVATAAAAVSGSGSGGAGASDAGAGLGEGNGTGVGQGDEAGIQPPPNNTSAAGVPPIVVEAVIGAIFSFSMVFLVVFAIAILLREGVRGLLERVTGSLFYLVALAVGFLLLLALLYLFSQLWGQGGGGALGSASSMGVGSEQEASGAVLDSQAPLIAVAIAVGLGVATLLTLSGKDIPSLRTASQPDPTPAAGAGGSQGQRFRGVHDDVPPTNEVYRAWLALAEAVDAPAGTPHEVARAARAAGKDPDAVAELTALFCEVRYGERGPDAEAERLAREARAVLLGGS